MSLSRSALRCVALAEFAAKDQSNENMTRLFSYCLRIDDGAAPNPFWGFCTLVICKPKIRRAAKEGDWIVGTGSRRSPLGDVSGYLVYAMRVSRKMSMEDYEGFVRKHCRRKVPSWGHADYRRWLGDAIYDFAHSPPSVRSSVHTTENRKK